MNIVMFIKKSTIIISFLSALIVGVICSMIVYTRMSQSPIMDSELYGTYQFNIRNLDNAVYLAVIPPSKVDENKGKGQFQWYNVKDEMLARGICKIDTRGFVTFYVDGKSIATLLVINKKYYFVDNSLEPQEITKISKVPMVSTPE